MAKIKAEEFDIELAMKTKSQILINYVKILNVNISFFTIWKIYDEITYLEELTKVSINKLCKIFKVSKSGYYSYLKNGDIVKKRNGYIANLIMEYEDVGFDAAGIKATTAYLRSLSNYPELSNISERRVGSIMRDYEIISEDFRNEKDQLILKGANIKYNISKSAPPAKPDMLNRKFCKFTKPCIAWCIDITEIKTKEGKLYMCAIVDLCGRYLVGYSVRSDLTLRIVKEAINSTLDNARQIMNLDHEPIYIHSDRGIQFRSKKIQKFYRENLLMSSMSQPYTPEDNGCIEAFFSNLKCECLYKYNLSTKDLTKKLIKDYVRFYNNIRVHRSIGIPPFMFWLSAANGNKVPEIRKWAIEKERIKYSGVSQEQCLA